MPPVAGGVNRGPLKIESIYVVPWTRSKPPTVARLEVKLRGHDRLELARLVIAYGETAIAARLGVGRVPLARGLAGLEVSERTGRRLVAAICVEWGRYVAEAEAGGTPPDGTPPRPRTT